MPKEHFSVAGSTALAELPAHARIHVIGVCGVAMAQLALELCNAGYRVSGSDKEFYEPMGELLRKSEVKLYEGYKRDNITADMDLVVIGNAVSYGHAEVAAVEELGVRYSFFPKLLYELIIHGRHSVVVAGTHGKTTTSALTAHVLEYAKLNPSYFVGGSCKDLPTGLKRGSGAACVVEGDEYDSAFFAKVPKFAFYKPDTLIVTSIEFDHADIYSSLEAIKDEFTKLICAMPASARAICCIDDAVVRSLLPIWRGCAACKFVTYGQRDDADYRALKITPSATVQLFHIAAKECGEVELKLRVPGAHNALNATAVFAACQGLNVESRVVVEAMLRFSGVKRRQDIISDGDMTLIEDFAHHPTAVEETLRAIRAAYGSRRLWAVFEPRSNTSRRKVFEEHYRKAFSVADRVVLARVSAKSIDVGQELLDVDELAATISQDGVPTLAFTDATTIAQYLAKEWSAGDVILVMSNGSFGGLVKMLQAALDKRG